MSAVLAAAIVLAPQGAPGVKYWTLDDFTVGAYTKTLTMGSDYKAIFGLDKRHCIFGQRRTKMQVNGNDGVPLTLNVGNGEQKLSSPAPTVWNFNIEYGGDGSFEMDLSTVDRFLVDYYTVPANKIADTWILYVMDKNGQGASNGSFHGGNPKGILFRKSEFSGTADWRHVVYFRFRQDFFQWPNPTTYSVTRLHATILPGATPPARLVSPFGG
ncbi:MAG: hypothetical protein JST30_01655 [Armatimonadetes bacterium]|nr:hypothetical protein [Armatimonadota bacterium]